MTHGKVYHLDLYFRNGWLSKLKIGLHVYRPIIVIISTITLLHKCTKFADNMSIFAVL